MTQEYNIDASGRALGRVASEAAKALMGKTTVDYTPNKRSDVKVSISNVSKLYMRERKRMQKKYTTNVSKLYMRERKRMQKKYTTYSGYPGGLKKESYTSLKTRKGAGEPLRLAIKRMLPRNTMLTERMKNLVIKE